MRRVSRKRTTRNSSPTERAESEQRTTKNAGYKSEAIAPYPAFSFVRSRLWIVVHFQLFAARRLRMAFVIVCFSLPAAVRRSFSAFCRLTRTHGIFRRRLFASGNRASFIFSLLSPEAYARHFLSLVFRLRLPCVVHFQPFAA